VTRLVRAAGGVLLRGDVGTRVVALVHRPAYDDWSFPKGKLEADEDERTAAIREVEEETGLRCDLDEDLGVVSYIDGRGRPKVVRYWRMTAPADAELAPAHEIDRAEWVPLDEAEERLTYPHDRELLARVTGQAVSVAPAWTYVIRHAKAGSRESWREPDELRPVSPAGRRQSTRLVELFDGMPVRRLFSSPFLRCIQTLEPLAEARNLDIDLAHELSEGAPIAAAEALILAAAADGPAAFSTHGDVQAGLVRDLLERGAHLEGEQIAFKKGSTWTLEVVGGKVGAVRYLPPPSSEAGG
jgi:8-oxo-dGTP diphosphatase